VSIRTISDACGQVDVQANRPGAGWAGQSTPANPADKVKLADFLANAGSAQHSGLYLFDLNLQQTCPALALGAMPEYFAQDLLQRTPPGTKYREDWPVPI
jgi:hypothetical protein